MLCLYKNKFKIYYICKQIICIIKIKYIYIKIYYKYSIIYLYLMFAGIHFYFHFLTYMFSLKLLYIALFDY